jgi:hypothetical protein
MISRAWRVSIPPALQKYEKEKVTMNNQNQEVRTMMDIIKTCFNELQMSVLKETIDEQGIGVLGTAIDLNSFSMSVEVMCPPNSTDLDIKIRFSHPVSSSIPFGIHLIVNRINGQVMDIAHLALNPCDEGLILQTSFDVSDQDSRQKQIIDSLNRVIRQGIRCFDMVLRIGEKGGFTMTDLDGIIEELLGKRSNKGKEIGNGH